MRISRLVAAGAALVALGALLFWWGMRGSSPPGGPAAPLPSDQGATSRAEDIPAELRKGAGSGQEEAVRQALDAAQKALSLLGRRPSADLSRRDALRLALDLGVLAALPRRPMPSSS